MAGTRKKKQGRDLGPFQKFMFFPFTHLISPRFESSFKNGKMAFLPQVFLDPIFRVWDISDKISACHRHEGEKRE